MRTNLMTGIAIVAVAAWLALHIAGVTWTPLREAGACIAAIALALLLTARIQLGRSFSVTPQARKLVTTGLYSRLRNPIYLFSALFIAGVAIASGHPKLLWFLVFLGPLQLMRARKEERLLTEAFGDEYRQYRAQTWF